MASNDNFRKMYDQEKKRRLAAERHVKVLIEQLEGLGVEPASPPPEPAPPSTPVNYTGGTQAKAPDIMHVEGREPRSPAPEVDLVARPTVDLADDDDIAW